MIAFDEVTLIGGVRHREALAALTGTLQFDDAINIEFTSGTTVSPKGVRSADRRIIIFSRQRLFGRPRDAPERQNDRIWIPVPLLMIASAW